MVDCFKNRFELIVLVLVAMAPLLCFPPHHVRYCCWWKKSCTTWDVKTPIKNVDKLPTSTGEFTGFLPSTVVVSLLLFGWGECKGQEWFVQLYDFLDSLGSTCVFVFFWGGWRVGGLKRWMFGISREGAEKNECQAITFERSYTLESLKVRPLLGTLL